MWILFTLLQATAAANPVPPAGGENTPGAQSEFQNRVRELAQAELLNIMDWGPLDVDGDGRTDARYARICVVPGPSRFKDGYLIADESGRHWAFEWPYWHCEHDDLVKRTRPRPPFPEWSENAARGIDLGDGVDECVLGPVDGRFELIRVTHATRSNIVSGRWTTDWGRQIKSGSYSQMWDDSQDYHDEAAMVIVEGPDEGGSRSTPETFNVILSGEENWQGKQDAALSVRAIQPDPRHVRLEFRIQDDRFVPLDESGKASDRVEMFWEVCRQECKANEKEWQPLQIGWSADGTVTARWSRAPADGPFPEVSAGGGSDDARVLHVLLPVKKFLRAHDDTDGVEQDRGWNTRFAALYADVDTPGGEVETVVATSRMAGSGKTLNGVLAKYPGFRRFPIDDLEYDPCDLGERPSIRRLDSDETPAPEQPATEQPAAKEPPAAGP